MNATDFDPIAAMLFDANQRPEPAIVATAVPTGDDPYAMLPEFMRAALTWQPPTVGYKEAGTEGTNRGKRMRAKPPIEHLDDPYFCHPDDVAKDPPKYHAGRFRFLPIKSCEDAAIETERRLGTDGRQFIAYCETCQESLGSPVITGFDGTEEEYIRDTISMFGLANDHARTTHNHAVLIVHEPSMLPLWMSAYDLRKSTSW